MDGEIQPVDGDREGRLALQVSALRDEIEKLERTRRGTLGGGVAITALFGVGSMFMERSGTAWFLGVMWLLLTLRLVAINRTSGRELRIKGAELESLAKPQHDAT